MESNFDKAKRLLETPSFRWMEGMLAQIPDYDGEGEWLSVRVNPAIAENWNKRNIGDALPDITDPATIGCLLFLLGEQFDIDTIIEVMGNPPGDLIA